MGKWYAYDGSDTAVRQEQGGGMMTPYERMVKCMRAQNNTPKGGCYAEALSEKEIRIADTRLDDDFFKVAEHVGKIKSGDILVCCAICDDEYVVMGKVVE